MSARGTHSGLLTKREKKKRNRKEREKDGNSYQFAAKRTAKQPMIPSLDWRI